MKFTVRNPSPLLKPWIECYWNMEFRGAAEKTETILPNGKIEMIFALEGDYEVMNRNTYKMNQAWLSGIHHGPLKIHYSGNSNLIGVRFYPHGIFPFFDIPIHETINQVENLNSFWGSFQDEIYEALCIQTKNEQIFSLLDQFLIRRIAEKKTKNYHALAHVIGQVRRNPSLSLSELTSSLGYTQRHFNRLFKDQTGINPKLLAQIFRFEKSFSYLFAHSDEDLLDIISSLGYYDQPHFIKEFKRFSGMTPREYVNKATHANNFL
jgi:AraC-like DNA-binding protein